MKDKIEKGYLPDWFVYPNDFKTFLSKGNMDFTPWHILLPDSVKEEYEGLKERYPNRTLVPFAKRQDNDDVACWEKDIPKVQIIHDYASPGWEQRKIFNNFDEWLRSAIDEMLQFEK